MGSCAGTARDHANEAYPSFYKNYSFGGILGQGSFGHVFIAEDNLTHETFAVKVQKGRLTGEEYIQYETSLWRKLGAHVHCVRLYGMYQEADVYFTVMEKCMCSLWERLTDAPKWTVADLVGDFKQIGIGIRYMHSLRIVHRDIKAENILYGGADGRTLKIADFGLAHFFTKTSKMLMKARGSAAYMAPEMLAGEGYAYSIDMWSFGVLCYVVLLGQFPCGQSNMSSAEMKQAILEVETEPVRLTRLAQQLKRELEELNQRQRNKQPSAVKGGAAEAHLSPVVPSRVSDDEHTRWTNTVSHALLLRRVAALGFVQGLLQRDPLIRLTAQAALRSDFLSNCTDKGMDTDSLEGTINTIMIVNRKPLKRKTPEEKEAAEKERQEREKKQKEKEKAAAAAAQAAVECRSLSRREEAANRAIPTPAVSSSALAAPGPVFLSLREKEKARLRAEVSVEAGPARLSMALSNHLLDQVSPLPNQAKQNPQVGTPNFGLEERNLLNGLCAGVDLPSELCLPKKNNDRGDRGDRGARSSDVGTMRGGPNSGSALGSSSRAPSSVVGHVTSNGGDGSSSFKNMAFGHLPSSDAMLLGDSSIRSVASRGMEMSASIKNGLLPNRPGSENSGSAASLLLNRRSRSVDLSISNGLQGLAEGSDMGSIRSEEGLRFWFRQRDESEPADAARALHLSDSVDSLQRGPDKPPPPVPEPRDASFPAAAPPALLLPSQPSDTDERQN